MWWNGTPSVWGSILLSLALHLQGAQAESFESLDHLLDGLDTPPLNDGFTFLPDRHNCPLPCSDYANVFSWVRYWTPELLRRCQEPMLLQFSIIQPLDRPDTPVPLYACTLGSLAAANLTTGPPPIENPKKSASVYKSSLDSALACAHPGTAALQKLELSSAGSRSSASDGSDVAALAKGMQSFFAAQDNCDENFAFAYHKQTVMGMYMGESLGKGTAESALKALTSRFQAAGSSSQPTVAQLCGKGRSSSQVLGIALDTTGDLSVVQKAASEWSQGNCVSALGGALKATAEPAAAQVFDIRQVLGGNSTTNGTLAGNKSRRGSLLSGLLGGRTSTRLAMRSRDLTSNSTTARGSSDAPPQQNADGTCATHVIEKKDTCSSLAKKYNITVDDIEKWNKGKTWAWTDCPGMMYGNNMCISDGRPALPPPHEGLECGPSVPGTQLPQNKSASMADLNPCPLNACCSNWGFCGVFPEHCEIHQPKGGGGPGAKDKNSQSTCISNCGRDIKQNSGPPSSFMRVGYYEAFGMDRGCLLLQSKDANIDGAYSHIHWAFAGVDGTTFKPIINDTKKQWADFKALPVKRIVSFGGWSFSTDAATFNIMRQAILQNRDTFINNIVDFVNKEGIDGVDIDWEYPAAPDIFAGGVAIGQKDDGIGYLKFLITLKAKLGAGKSLSIAAPASFWYLKPFPIDRMAKVVDYIVYMTYDLHGQWDYGNVNAFDACPSGKCIRSHVNLTETRNSLSIITKAGVANNKVIVGEASYGRSFHMAQNGCWGPMCEFTGSRTQSDATPGRCTKTAGYISNAEINELISNGAQSLFDSDSDTDVVLSNGDYIGYMTPTTKDTRRADWVKLNFGGSVDWALDLQEFTSGDMNAPVDRPDSGNGCLSGSDLTVNTGDVCEFTCDLGYCPESLCYCTETGDLSPLPAVTNSSSMDNLIAWDDRSVEMNKLCKFSCKYGYCPGEVCTSPFSTEDDSDDDGGDSGGGSDSPPPDAGHPNQDKCFIYKDGDHHDDSLAPCKIYCKPQLDEAAAEGRTSNYGCVGFWPLDQPIPWQNISGFANNVASGTCNCDNMLVNEIADTVLEALPIIAQIGCYIVMSSLKLVLDVGLNLFSGPISAGLNAVATAAQIISYVYPSDQDPSGAFNWWLSPCGGSNLVPDDIKKAFGILDQVAGSITGFKPPKNIPKGSGRHGDDGNPKDQSKPRPTDKEPKPKTKTSSKPDQCTTPPARRDLVPATSTAPDGSLITLAPRMEDAADADHAVDVFGQVDEEDAACRPKTKTGCKIPRGKEQQRLGEALNTLRKLQCVGDKVKTYEMIITSIVYARGAKTTQVAKVCDQAWTQACYHYSSAIRNNPQWATITCPPVAATTQHRLNAKATSTWSSQHRGNGWTDRPHRQYERCDMDEFPPAHLLDKTDPAFVYAGTDRRGQRVRFVPNKQNQKAGKMWKGACFMPPVKDLSDTEFQNKVAQAPPGEKQVVKDKNLERTSALVTVTWHPEFVISGWGQNPDPDDGLHDNPCWPSAIAPQDPGFAVLAFDEYYDTHPHVYNYEVPYNPPHNGV